MKFATKIAPCLWFDSAAEEAARFYTSIFKNSRIVKTSYFTEAGFEIHGRPAGSVMTVEFELEGQSFTALNGGPMFQFSEAISLQVYCDSQEEVDYFWERLLEGGTESHCGWLKDQFGLSWQVSPAEMADLVAGPDPAGASRAMAAMLTMSKIDLAEIRRAYKG